MANRKDGRKRSVGGGEKGGKKGPDAIEEGESDTLVQMKI